MELGEIFIRFLSFLLNSFKFNFFAIVPAKFGISFNKPSLNQAGALINVYSDGSIRLNHGGTEMGQGLFIKVAQVVAECFGVSIEKMELYQVAAADNASIKQSQND